MKKHLKLWIALLTLALVFAVGFTVSALAADEIPEYDPTNPLSTPYGMIPSDYEDVDLYPFVAFDDKGNFVEGSAQPYLWNDGNKATETTPAHPDATIRTVTGVGNYFIYMRKDHTLVYSYNNISNINGHVTIDLGGHTLTYSKALNGQLKSYYTKTTYVTFKNGTLHAASAKQHFLSMTIGTGDKIKQATAFDFTFDGITFTTCQNFASNAWVLECNATTAHPTVTNGFKKIVTIKDCTFNMENVTGNPYIAIVGHQTGAAITEVTLSGIHIVGNPSKINLVKQSYTENVTISYVENEDGYIVTNTRPTVDGVPEDGVFYDIPGGPVALCKVVSTDEEAGTTTYTLSSHERLTPYGWIPESYTDTTLYPLLLFNDTTKTCVWGGNDWGDQNGTKGVLAQLSATSALNNENGRGVIYLQADQEDKATYTDESGTKIARDPYYNFGGVRGQHIVDLNGHTLTANSHVFFATNKDKTTNGYSSCLVFNGTINLQKYSLLVLGSNAYSTVYSKVFDFTFENVDIISNNSTNPIVADGIGANFITTYNISFKDCDFTLAQNYTGPMFNLGVIKTGTTTDGTLTTSSKDITVNVFLEGGSITHSASRMPVLYKNESAGTENPMENKTFTLVEGANGFTEIRTLNTFTTMLPEGYAFNDNTYIFDGKDDTYSYYRIALEHKYGFISPYLTDATKYPIVIFDADAGYSITGFDKWGDETNAEKNTVGGAAQYLRNQSSLNLVAFLQADLPDTTVYYNSGGMYGNKVVDLNGHTISLIDVFFHGEAKTKNQLDLVIKNGTFNVGAKKVLTACAVKSDYVDPTGRIMNVTFENVTFANIAKNGGIFEEGGNGSDKAMETNVRYVNCNYQINDGNNTAIIVHGTNQTTSPTHKVNVSIEGGTFTYAGNLANIHYCQYAEALASQQVVFKKYNDAYPTVIAAQNTNPQAHIYTGENAQTLGLRTVATSDADTTYVMTPVGFVSAYLNLTNDLNFVYRVFVPAAYTAPVMTFTVGTSVVEVSECFVDENGYSCYRLPNINPARMGETISAVLTATYGEETVTLTHNTLSVNAYAEALKALEEAKAEEECNTSLITLVDNLLVYGAAASHYVSESTDAFEAVLGDISSDADILSMSGTASEKGGIGYFGMNLDGAFAFRLGVIAKVEGLTLVAKCGEEEVVFNLDDYTADEDGIITIVYDGILANELDTTVTFTMMDGEEVVGKVLTVNANSYLYRASVGTNAKLASLAKALYAYGVSAKNYAQ